VRGLGLGDSALVDVPEVNVGSDGVESQWRAFVRFDTSAIPSRALVQSATLVLTAGDLQGGTDKSTQLRIYRVSEPWSPDRISWNNQPALEDGHESEVPVTRVDREVRFDLTSLVIGWHRQAIDNRGLGIRVADETKSLWKGFRTVQAPGPVAGPRLEVRYLCPEVVD
jgi:hypothetical protein